MTVLSFRRMLFFFLVLSVADFTLTWHLLQRAGGQARESNPVACWWLAHFGWPGLAGFKLGLAGVVAILVRVVARRRPPAARLVLRFGCSVLLAVVLYSGFLLYGVEAGAAEEAAEKRRIAEWTRELDRETDRLRHYYALVETLRVELADGRRTLAEAVEFLAESESAWDPHWVPQGQLISSLDPTKGEGLAIRLVSQTLAPLERDPNRWKEVARDLDAQFRSCFGRPPPRSVFGPLHG
jgi:hypothetical protein